MFNAITEMYSLKTVAANDLISTFVHHKSNGGKLCIEMPTRFNHSLFNAIESVVYIESDDLVRLTELSSGYELGPLDLLLEEIVIDLREVSGDQVVIMKPVNISSELMDAITDCRGCASMHSSLNRSNFVHVVRFEVRGSKDLGFIGPSKMKRASLV